MSNIGKIFTDATSGEGVWQGVVSGGNTPVLAQRIKYGKFKQIHKLTEHTPQLVELMV